MKIFLNTLYQDFRLGIQFFYRERHVPALKTLLIALTAATFIMMVLNGLNDHAWRTLYQRASVSFGAELILNSSQPIETAALEQAKEHQLRTTHVQNMLTMASHQEAFQLVSLKAVGQGYPLLGEVTLSNGQKTYLVSHAPQAGTVWVEDRLLKQLKIKLGDSLQIGRKTFVISNVIQKEPDSAGSLVLIAPRVMMALSDLATTEVVQPGSRVNYQFWMTGEAAEIQAYKTWALQQRNLNWSLQDVSEGNSPIQRFMGYAQSYLGLIVMLTVLLAGLSVSLSARFWIRQRIKMIALYQVLGAQPSRILKMILFGFLSWGIFLVLLAVMLGQAANVALVKMAQIWLPTPAYQASLMPTVLSIGIGLFILLGFSLPEVLGAKKVPPSWILRGQVITWRISLLLYLGVLIACIGILFWYVQNLQLTLILVAGLGWAAFIAYCVLLACLWGLGKLKGNRLVLRYALRQLSYHRTETAQQVVAFTLVLISVLVLWGAQHDFLQSWKASLPANTPNHFLINITPEQQQGVQALLEHELHQPITLYPMVRGRLTHINDEAVKVNSDDPGPEGIGRPLNMTWMSVLPEDNPMVAGKPFTQDSKGKALISIEQRFASRLQVGLGDALSFEVSGQTVSGVIDSIRTVEWQSFKPNFYVIFPPGILDKLPFTSMTSFYLQPSQSQVLVRINQEFPEVTIVDVAKVIDELQSLLGFLATGIQALLLLVMVFTFIIFYVILTASMPQRARDAAMIRLVGGSKILLTKMNVAEFTLLGLITGLVGVIASQWILFQLANKVFDLNYSLDPQLIGFSLILTVSILVFFGWFTLRKTTRQSPLTLLR